MNTSQYYISILLNKGTYGRRYDKTSKPIIIQYLSGAQDKPEQTYLRHECLDIGLHSFHSFAGNKGNKDLTRRSNTNNQRLNNTSRSLGHIQAC